MSTGPTTARKGSAEKAIPHTRIQDDAMIRDNYDVGEKIGQGTFGKVYEATHKSTGVKWAIKSINKEKAGSLNLRLVEREVAILKRVNHPNIINLNEVIESPKRMYLVMEICTEGELADRLKENKLFSEAETKQVMLKLAGAISYLHKHGIVHRDLKLENILMGENPDNADDKLHIKVTDFGLSVVKGGVTPDSMMQDFCGTPIYMAPEILDNKTYSQQCDVWALGIIMYSLMCGNAPFRAKEESALYDLIREANVQFDDEVWSSVSQECKNCILGMLKVDPAHRLSAAEVLNHPWITGQARKKDEPTNVLEMMKMWKDELKHETVNSGDEDDTVDTVDSSLSTSSKALSDEPTKAGRGGRKSPHTREKVSDAKDPGVKRRTDNPSPPAQKSTVTTGKKTAAMSTPKATSRSSTPSGASKVATTGNGISKTPAAITTTTSKMASSLNKAARKK